MSKNDQKRIVKELAASISIQILEQIDSGKIPEEWDGNELRVLFSQKAQRAASSSEIRREPRRKRTRDFNNYCLVNYL